MVISIHRQRMGWHDAVDGVCLLVSEETSRLDETCSTVVCIACSPSPPPVTPHTEIPTLF